MNTVALSFGSLIFLAAIAIGTAQIRRGHIASGLLWLAFGMGGFLRVHQVQVR